MMRSQLGAPSQISSNLNFAVFFSRAVKQRHSRQHIFCGYRLHIMGILLVRIYESVIVR